MWNIYSLIKSGTLKPIIWESAFDREIREADAKKQRKAEELLGKIPQELIALENGLARLTQISEEDERWNIASEVDQNSRMLSVYATFGMISPKAKEVYGNVVQALQKTSEVLAKYPDLDLFSNFSRDRKSDLIETAKEYHLEAA